MTDAWGAKPFRWNVARREQLGELSDVAPATSYDGFRDDLRVTAAKVIARGGDCDLVFLGRSLESLFDYLSGIVEDVEAAPSLTLLQYSSPSGTADHLARHHRPELDALLAYFTTERLDPAAITGFGKPVRFVDVVASGGTFAGLVDMLRHWSETQGIDFNAVLRRIGFVGLTRQRQTSPNTRRWWQQSPWTELQARPRITNVSVPPRLWSFVADSEAKVTPSHRLYRWSDPQQSVPVRNSEHLAALRRAVDLFDAGRTRAERQALARLIARAPEMREAWLRTLVLRLRGRGPERHFSQ